MTNKKKLLCVDEEGPAAEEREEAQQLQLRLHAIQVYS